MGIIDCRSGGRNNASSGNSVIGVPGASSAVNSSLGPTQVVQVEVSSPDDPQFIVYTE